MIVVKFEQKVDPLGKNCKQNWEAGDPPNRHATGRG